MINSQFSVARLSPELLTQVQQFERKLSTDTKENIVLIAYTDNDSESPKSPSSHN